MKSMSAEDFVRSFISVYKENGTSKELADKLGLKQESVVSRANQYRKLGIKLPQLKQNAANAALDVSELQSLIDNI